jgi:hypothetical protein
MASIQAAVGSLKTATDIVSTFAKLKAAAEVQDKVIELQGVILAAHSSTLNAQHEQFAMLERVRTLEAQVAKFETWEAEKQRYELTELPPGVFVYSLKPAMANGEQLHHLCEHCFQESKKSVLHKTEPVNGRYHLKCSRCGTDHLVGRYVAPAAKRARTGSWMAY